MAGLATDPTVDFLQAAPTELIAQMRAGRLDAALVSSVEAVRVEGYRVAADLGIAARHEVRSVRAFRRRGTPVRSVGLDQSSATSVTLLRLLLRGPRRPDCAAPPAPDFQTIAPTRSPDELPQDLVLLIGDPGLEAEGGYREVWDLATEWRRWTGLPFVFAVWLLAPGVDDRRLIARLREARREGQALGAVDGTHGAVHYELDDQDLTGLRRFWQLAREADLAAVADPAFVTA
jgi:chorismate dehydratase